MISGSDDKLPYMLTPEETVSEIVMMKLDYLEDSHSVNFLLTIPATPFSVLTSSYRSSLSYNSPSVLHPYRLIRYLGISFLSAVPNCESEICIDLKNRRWGCFYLLQRVFAGDEEVSYIYSATGEKLA